MDQSRIFIGTAGWSIASRHGQDFAAGGTHLERYGTRLGAVEINSSFYRPHRRATYAKWAQAVPAGFRFSVKMPKTITHERRLADCGALLDAFLDEAGGLGEKLGVLLVQLPPNLPFEADAASAFFTALRARFQGGVVCEPRHRSWFEARPEAMLVERQVARVAADPAPHPGAEKPGGWPGLAYFRLHGSPRIYRSDYSPEALQGLAERFADAGAAEIWCIFDNTAEGHALGNALVLDGTVNGGFER